MSDYTYRELRSIIRGGKATIGFQKTRIANIYSARLTNPPVGLSTWYVMYHQKYGYMNEQGAIVCDPAYAKLYNGEFEEESARALLVAPDRIKKQCQFVVLGYALMDEQRNALAEWSTTKDMIKLARIGLGWKVARDLFSLACVASATFFMYKMS